MQLFQTDFLTTDDSLKLHFRCTDNYSEGFFERWRSASNSPVTDPIHSMTENVASEHGHTKTRPYEDVFIVLSR